MYQNISVLLSILFLIGYLYLLTKNKLFLWISWYGVYFALGIYMFKICFPAIQFFSPSLEYLIFLIIMGIPFLILIVFIGVEAEKQKTHGYEEEGQFIGKLLKLTKNNIIFWTIIVLINLVGWFFDNLR